MKIFITGGSGFVGSHLTRELTGKGHQVTVLTRRIKPGKTLPAGAGFSAGDPNVPGPWQEEAAQHDLLINLAGASIFSRWTTARKDEIRNSRINTTHHLVDAIEMAAKDGKKVDLLSTSAVGYYGNRQSGLLNEESPAGDDFLAGVARDWEREALRAESFGGRVVRCRFGIVLGAGGGALGKMLPVFKLGLGSWLGSGRQWFPWIHQGELSRIFAFLVEHRELNGAFNCVAPEAVNNADFSRQLAARLGKRLLPLGVPAPVLKLALGEMAEVLLGGQQVTPASLQQAGYEFQFADLDSALADLLPAPERTTG